MQLVTRNMLADSKPVSDSGLHDRVWDALAAVQAARDANGESPHIAHLVEPKLYEGPPTTTAALWPLKLK